MAQVSYVSDPRSELSSQNISSCFSGCIRSHNKNRLLGLLQSGRNPNKVVGDFDVSSALASNPEKLEKINPYLENSLLPSTSVLHEAIIYNDEDAINILLNFGARINDFCGMDRQGLSCLMLAVILEHNNLLDLLVKRGCNYSLFNYEQRTALDLAIINNNIEAIGFFAPFKRFFYFKTSKKSKLTVNDYLSKYSGHGSFLQVVDQMVTIGYDLGDSHGQHILLDLLDRVESVDDNVGAIVRNLIKHYKETSQNDLVRDPIEKSGQTVLHTMTQKCNSRMVKVLIDVGADVNDCDYEGDTPLHIALRAPVTSKGIGLIGILLQSGADLFKRNKNKLSPLDIALDFSQVHSTIVRFVSSQAGAISRGYKLHEFLEDGKATLNSKVLQFLRSRGVTFQSLNSNKQSSLHVLLDVHGSTASLEDLMQCINVLADNESILDIVDNNGMNAAMIALTKNVSPSIVMKLISGPTCTQHINPKGQDILSMIISGYKAKDEEKLYLVQLAVKKGALVNNPSRFGCKSLIAACEEAGLSAQGIPKFLLSKGFRPLREDIDCISTWSLSLLQLTLNHCNSIIIRTQFPNILINTFETFIPRINDAKSCGVNILLSITRKLVQEFHIDVNYSERGKHVLHLLIQLKVTHKYPVCPLIKELLTQESIDLNAGYDGKTGNPLTHALRVGEFSIADMLIKSMNDFSKTNIHKMALKFGFSGIVVTLLKKGVRIDHKFFERAFGQQEMGIIEEMDWLRNFVRKEMQEMQTQADSKVHVIKKLKIESA